MTIQHNLVIKAYEIIDRQTHKVVCVFPCRASSFLEYATHRKYANEFVIQNGSSRFWINPVIEELKVN